jgi:hypothetical protein
MDRNSRIGRRERREILKKGPGEGVVAVDAAAPARTKGTIRDSTKV